MAESCFSCNGSSSFLHISNDNRIHLWNTDSKKELRTYVEKQHLAHSYTCSTWRAGKKDNLGYFAVGASDGTIIVWDLTRGVVSKVIGKLNESPVPTSLAFSNDGKTLLVSSNQNDIVQYDLITGDQVHTFKAGKKGVVKMALNPRVDVVAAAGSSVRVVDVQSGRKRKLEAQFSGGIVALSFTQCGRYLAVAGSGSREVLLFDVQAGAEATPLAAIAVAGEPKSFVVRSASSEGVDRIEVLCIFEDIDGCFIRYATKGGSEETRTSICKISTGTAIMAGRFGNSTGGRSPTDITLAAGQKSSPVFSTLTIIDAEGKLLESVSISRVVSASTSGEVTTSRQSEVVAASSAALVPIVLGPHESSGRKRPLLADDMKDGDKEKKSRVASGTDEMTLEERLEILSNSLMEVEKLTNTPATSSSMAVEEGPSANSLVVIIEQALQSGDDALLEQSLACNDVSIIEGSAKRLSAGRVVQLLRKLVAKFEKRPSRGLLLTRWLAAVLRFHTSFLISVPDLSAQLSGLSQMLEHRLSSYSKLAALGGRLDLLMSQITTISESNGYSNNAAVQDSTIPRQVYRE